MDEAGNEIVDSTSETVEGTTPTIEAPEQTSSEPVAPLEAQPTATNEQDANKQDVLDQLIASKYKGDRSAFVKGLYENWNSNSSLNKKLELLEARLAERQQPEPEPLETNEDYSSLKEEITVLDSQLAGNDATRKSILASFNSLQMEIATLDGKIGASQDPNAKSHFEFLKWQKNQEKRQLESSWNQSYKDDASINREKKLITRQLREVEKAITSSRTQQQQQYQEDARDQESFLQDFGSAVDAVCQEKGIATDSDTRSYLYETIKAQAAIYLVAQLKKDPNYTLDPFEYVKNGADAYFRASGFNAKQAFQQVSQQKLAATKSTVGKPTLNTPPGKPNSSIPKFKSGEEAREWTLKRMEQIGSKPRQA
jgi:hypothetical protein